MGRSFGTGHGSLPNRESYESDLRVHLRNWARNGYIRIYIYFLLCFWEIFKNLCNLFLWLSIYNELFKVEVSCFLNRNCIIVNCYDCHNWCFNKWEISLKEWLVIKYQFKDDWKTLFLKKEKKSVQEISLEKLLQISSILNLLYSILYFILISLQIFHNNVTFTLVSTCIFDQQYKESVLSLMNAA